MFNSGTKPLRRSKDKKTPFAGGVEPVHELGPTSPLSQPPPDPSSPPSSFIGRPDAATFRRVTNVVDERKYKDEAKLRELAQRYQQSPLRFVRPKDSPNDPNLVAENYFEYRSKRYDERKLQQKKEEQRQMEEWEKSRMDLLAVGLVDAEDDDNEGGEDEDDEHSDDGNNDELGSSEQKNTTRDEGAEDEPRSVRDLLRERKRKKKERERAKAMAQECERKEENERVKEGGLTIRDLLERRREEKKKKMKKKTKKKHQQQDGDGDEVDLHKRKGAQEDLLWARPSRLPSVDEEAEEWEWQRPNGEGPGMGGLAGHQALASARRMTGSGGGGDDDDGHDLAKETLGGGGGGGGGGLGQLFGKMKKRSVGKGNGGGGEDGFVAISEPDRASFKKLNNPIEMRNTILQRLSSERRQATPNRGKVRVILDVVVVEAWDLQIADGRHVAPYCALKLEGTVHRAETSKEQVSDPMWNQDLTFAYYEGDGNERDLVVSVYNASRSRGKPTLLGAVSIDPEQFQDGQTWDLWLDLRDPNAPLTWRWDRRLDELPVLLVQGSSPTPPLHGFVHLKIHKNAQRDLGILSFYGQPLSALPLRVDVGDIVLFSSEKELAKQCIQIATSSKWDHMAMIVRMRGAKSMLLLESTMDGVDVFNVNERLDFYRETCSLGIRRLQLQRTPEMTQAMLSFVDKVVGKPYNKNFVELVKGKWAKNHEDNVSSYFCSQLVAAAYQKMGLLSPAIPSTNYYPAHFEGDRKRLRLLNDARLSEVYVIPCKEAAEMNLSLHG